MNVLLVHSQTETLDMLTFVIESKLGHEVQVARSFKEAVSCLMEDSSVDLIIAPEKQEDLSLIRYLKSTKAQIPVIFISENVALPLETAKGLNVLARLTRREIPTRLIDLIQAQSKVMSAHPESLEYFRVAAELLLKVVPLKGDVFIRLSNVKYVKLFQAGVNFTRKDLEKIWSLKKIPHLYVHRDTASEFAKRFGEELQGIINTVQEGDPQIMHTVVEVQDVVLDMIQKSGFSEEVQELSQKNVQLVIKSVGKSPRLERLFELPQLKQNNYISMHSILVSHIACCIASELNWPSQTTFRKIVMAAFFHDIAFKSADLAKIHTLAELEVVAPNLSEAEHNLVKNHMNIAGEFLRKFNEIPEDVDLIIQQHHERPDGTGFPLGIRAYRIAPLAAVMIVAHDLVDFLNGKEMTEAGFHDFFMARELYYSVYPFKGILRALLQTRTVRTA